MKEALSSQPPLILIVEDGPYIGAMVRAALEDEGYRVELRPTGQAGLEAVRELKPDAVVLDLMLPDTDGGQVLDEMKGDPATAGIPVVVMSAVAATLKPAQRKQIAGVINKPFQLEDLFEKLEQALG